MLMYMILTAIMMLVFFPIGIIMAIGGCFYWVFSMFSGKRVHERRKKKESKAEYARLNAAAQKEKLEAFKAKGKAMNAKIEACTERMKKKNEAYKERSRLMDLGEWSDEQEGEFKQKHEQLALKLDKKTEEVRAFTKNMKSKTWYKVIMTITYIILTLFAIVVITVFGPTF